MNIGPIDLPAPFVQAALSGYSDLPMRRVARRYGAVYTLNEVVLDRLVVQRGKLQSRILNLEGDDHPVGGQIMGADPEGFGLAADAMASAGYDAIDINFGCPVRKVLGRCRGGFLLSKPDAALQIIRCVIDAVGARKPVTVKMRRGTDDSAESERSFFRILDGAFSCGVNAVTVHGRTVAQRYVGPSRWPFLAEVKKYVGDRVILGSGDLFSAEACVRMIHETGVDGVTIARGCIGNPWIFRECNALWNGQALPQPPSIEAQREAITVHWTEILRCYGEELGTRIVRKFGIKYSEHHPLPGSVRDAFVAARTAGDIERILETWFDPETAWPPVRRREGHGDLVAAGAAP